MDTLVRSGLVELALGALAGWAVVLRLERPELLTRLGIRSPRRLLQAHLDYVIMGVIAIAVGAVLPGLAGWAQGLLIVGTWVNPTLFLPLAFDEGWAQRPVYRTVTIVSFAAMSASLVAAAVTGLTT